MDWQRLILVRGDDIMIFTVMQWEMEDNDGEEGGHYKSVNVMRE